MAIEIVDLPTKNGDVPYSYVILVYQRVILLSRRQIILLPLDVLQITL